MNLEEEFVPYKESLKLKELGFDEPCFGYRDGGGYLMIKSISHCAISAPTFSQAFRWFREKHNIHSWIINAEDNHKVFKPFFRGDNIHDQHLIDFYETYEEAELACLIKLIEIVKSKSE